MKQKPTQMYWKAENDFIGTVEPDTQTIGYVSDHRNRRMWTEEEKAAITALISTAPELLRECEKASRQLRSVASAINRLPYPQTAQLRQALDVSWENINAVIVKAKGEEPLAYFDRIDVLEAWFVFLSHYHDGRGRGRTSYGRLCRVVSLITPRPSLFDQNDLTENGLVIYNQLVKQEEASWDSSNESSNAEDLIIT